MTYQLPMVIDRIEKIKPDWYVQSCKQLIDIKLKVGCDFKELMNHIDNNMSCVYYDVIEFTEEQKNLRYETI